MRPVAPTRHVLMLVDTATTWGADVIRGADEYAQIHASGWQLDVQPHGEFERLRVPRDWRGDGVIARVTEPGLAAQLQRAKTPVVNVSWSHIPGTSFTRVMPDETGVAQLAATHLLERGFRRFAYLGLPRQPGYVDRCGPAFLRELAAHGCSASVFASSRNTTPWRSVTDQAVRAWLASLPKPVGILAWGPDRGRNITSACRQIEIAIPDEVAVLTTSDDLLLCGISHPPLSAVDERPRVVGWHAARLLDRLMAGEQTPDGPALIPPQRVVTRLSTDAFALDDAEVAQALRFIRDHFTSPIDVGDVVRAIPISRRMLEQRFQTVLGRSPAAEIRRARIARATELLISTDWKVQHIAQASGFAHVEGMNRVFRRELGTTPSEYRSCHR